MKIANTWGFEVTFSIRVFNKWTERVNMVDNRAQNTVHVGCIVNCIFE